MGMSATYVLLLIGSLAFGLEALLLGLGGQLPLMYRRKKPETVGLAFGIGLAIICPSIAIAAVLGIGPIYACVLVVVFMFLAGWAVKLSKAKFIKPSPLRLPPPTRDAEIREMLQKKGLGALAKKKKR